MDILPGNLLEYEKTFNSVEDCIKHLEKVRWPDGLVCPKCQNTEHCKLEVGMFQCNSCRKQTSVTAGTIFHKTHLSLLIWFRVIYLLAIDKGGVSSTRIAAMFGIQQKTAWLMLHKLREAMGQRNDLYKIKGDIELDEAFINKEARKNQQNPKTESTIIVMVEEINDHAGNIFVQVIKSASSAVMRDMVDKATQKEKKHNFKMDAWAAHIELKKMGHNIDMKPLPGKLGIEKLPWVHTFISLIRRYLVGTYHGVSPRLLQHYLDEFVFRANRRFSQTKIWQSLVRACSFAKPFTLADLNG